MATTTSKAVANLPVELHGQTLMSAKSFDEQYRIAQVFHASGMFKDVTDAAQAFVKIMKGQELGFPPTTSMSAFDIIRDRLFMKPWAIAAKINACGYGSYEVVEQTEQQCIIVFRRRYPTRGWVDLEPVSYTFQEAKAHGLIERSPHWKASPAHQLYLRCMGRGGLMHFPELLAGLPPAPDDTPITAERHAQNVRDLFGEPVQTTEPPPRETSRVETPAPENATLGVTSAGTAVETPPADSQADAALLALQTDVEATILTSGGELEPWYAWAERRLKKPRSTFTVEDYALMQAAVEKAAELSAEHAAVTPTEAAADQPDLWHQEEEAERLAREQGLEH
jgi:hypothetical protein